MLFIALVVFFYCVTRRLHTSIVRDFFLKKILAVEMMLIWGLFSKSKIVFIPEHEQWTWIPSRFIPIQSHRGNFSKRCRQELLNFNVTHLWNWTLKAFWGEKWTSSILFVMDLKSEHMNVGLREVCVLTFVPYLYIICTGHLCHWSLGQVFFFSFT